MFPEKMKNGLKLTNGYIFFMFLFIFLFEIPHKVENVKVETRQDINKQCEELGSAMSSCGSSIQSEESCLQQGCCWNRNQSSCVANTGMVRLRDGVYFNSGRLELFHDGEWGTVCDDGWNEQSAQVACTQLGFMNSYPMTDQSLYNTIATGRILVDDIDCSGHESSLLECGHRPIGNTDCSHGEDVGLLCESSYPEGHVRLVEGPDNSAGRLEVYYHGRFGTVCDDHFDHYAADVACRQLGYSSGWPVGSAYFSPGNGAIWLDDLRCSGGESGIASCEHPPVGTHDCTHSEDAGVICDADNDMLLKEGEVRLTGWNNDYSGNVEIYHAGSWGRVCSRHWTDAEADIVCRQLGFVTGYVSNGIFIYPEPTMKAWLNEVSCSGSETRFESCSHGLWDHYECPNGMDNAVQCDSSNVGLTDQRPPLISHIRLVGSDAPYKGRVEVLINGKYGTVCDDGFDNNAATVVCKSLGFVSGVTSPIDPFGRGDGPIWLDDVFCLGDELRLEECSHRIWGTHDCSHNEDVAVLCQIGSE